MGVRRYAAARWRQLVDVMSENKCLVSFIPRLSIYLSLRLRTDGIAWALYIS